MNLPFQVIPEVGDDRLSAYDYVLPRDRIAQNPVVPRDHARLLAVTSPTTFAHHQFRDLPDLLKPGDLLVMNDTRVIPARLYGVKVNSTTADDPVGAKIEILLLEQDDTDPLQWLALVKPGKRVKPDSTLIFPDPQHPDRPLKATIMAIDEPTGGRILRFDCPDVATFWSTLHRLGQVPLPPYISESHADAEQYQTVYSAHPGAVAAPTAGLHFTPTLLDRLRTAGIDYTTITLHVGVGTFRPVEVEHIADHVMHSEWVEILPQAAEQIRSTLDRGGRIIAVGTTVVRSLEGVMAQTGRLQPFQGKVNLFIYPGFQWQIVSGLITNFHLPKSSLLMLVSALVGRKRLLGLYQEAIDQGYRFYSFGDAMLILPHHSP